MPLFYEINEMPMIVDLVRLDDGGGIEDTLKKKQAQYSINVQNCDRFP